MTELDCDLLLAVIGGLATDDHPNLRRVQLQGVHDSLDRQVSDFTCWDSKANPDYSVCAPSSEVTNDRPYGSWYLPNKFIADHTAG